MLVISVISCWSLSEPDRIDRRKGRAVLAQQRQVRILAELRRAGAVRVSDLTDLLNVSDMTIRRDLDALARTGVIEKVHGGAVMVEEARTHEPGFEAKSALELSAKEEIPWDCGRLVIGTGASGALPIMDDVLREAERRGVEIVALPTAEALVHLHGDPTRTNAVLHVTC